MGQAASKATEAVKRATTDTAPRFISKSQRTRAVAEAEWRRSSDAAPSSSITNQKQQDGVEVMPEMPPDLIKFLNDAGPLQRTIDKELTSPKVYDSLIGDDKARDEQRRQANKRVRRKMPIITSPHLKEGGSDVNDGTMVERSTNFSTTDRTKSSMMASSGMPQRLSITREDIFKTSTTLQSLQIDTPQWKKVIDTKYNELMMLSSNNGNDDPKIGPKNNKSFNTLKDLHLFENTMRYVGVPVIMKDSDGDIIGVWEKKVEDVKHSNGLKIVNEGSVEFVMKNESGV